MALARIPRAPRGTVGWLLLAAGCASDSPAPPDLPDDPAARIAEIERLEARIASDRATLASRVTVPRDLDRAPLHDDAELRRLAERLTANTARLERLRRPDAADPR